MAPINPSFTILRITISCVPCKTPTIMKCPNNLLTALSQIVKQYIYVNIVTMNIMKMNYIRIIYFNPFDKSLSSYFATKSSSIQKPCLQSMKFNIKVRTNFHSIFLKLFKERILYHMLFSLHAPALQEQLRESVQILPVLRIPHTTLIIKTFMHFPFIKTYAQTYP